MQGFTALNTALAADGAVLVVDPDASSSSGRSTSLYPVERAGGVRRPRPRTLCIVGRHAQVRDRRVATPARPGRSTSPTRSPRSSAATVAGRALPGAAREPGGATTSPARICTWPRPRSSRPRTSSLGGAIVRNDVNARARRRGHRLHAERALPGRRRPPRRQPHDHRPRQAALREPRALQGHARRPRPGRVQRQDLRPRRTRRRPTPSRPTRCCCSRTTRPSTPSRSSRSSPTT